jgi:hypothetical protein
MGPNPQSPIPNPLSITKYRNSHNLKVIKSNISFIKK